MLPVCSDLLLRLDESVLYITFNRPNKKNALNGNITSELVSVFDSISDDRSVRAVVLRGCDGNFCAGGDISDMGKDYANETSLTKKQILINFNRQFGHLISTVNKAPQLVVTLLEGAVLGGGFGLACVSDVAISDVNAMFAMPETGLGIIPAQIAPFVVERVGITQTRRLALLGERINGKQAQDMGMVHFVTESEIQIQEKLEHVLKMLKRCAPKANAVTKELILRVGSVDIEDLLDDAAEKFVHALNADEGLEGTKAFLSKRKSSWSF